MDPKSMDNFQKSLNRKRPELGYGLVTTIEQKIAYLAQYAGQVAKRARKDEAPARAPAQASASTPGDPTPLATPLEKGTWQKVVGLCGVAGAMCSAQLPLK